MSAQSMILTTDSPDQTAELAKVMAPALGPGDVMLLDGPVGAGKTHFARALIQALLVTPEDVPSPTYTLVQSYHGRTGEIWHADLYRISDLAEIEELGLLQAFNDAICLIEWPDRLDNLAPESALHMQFEQGPSDDARTIRLTWSDPKWTTLAKGLTYA
jgi:tRNA threonylcarbamoyladenosine biosynthesis protein TsaE